MNMLVKPSFPLPHSSIGLHPAKDGPHAPDASAVKAAGGKGAEALGAMQLTSLAVFHELAGMPQGRDLAGRHARLPQPNGATPGQRNGGVPARGTNRQRGPLGSGASAGGKLEQDGDSLLGRKADGILKRIRTGDHSSLQQDLSEQYDPLERYRLLEEALKKLGRESHPEEDEAASRRLLGRLLSDLDKEHGPEIREGLEVTGDMHALLQSLGAASVNSVRGWFGTARVENAFAPLTAVDLALRLRDAFGAGHFADALSRLGRNMARNLSVRSHRYAGEPPLMALSDTRAFTAVRSCHAKAQELMRDLGDVNVSVRDRQGPVELAITLMKMAGGGKEQAMNLSTSVIDWDKLSTRQKSRAWGSLGKTCLPPMSKSRCCATARCSSAYMKCSASCAGPTGASRSSARKSTRP